VVIDNKLGLKNVDQLLSDDIGGSVKLVTHLIDVHGYKNIACISGPLDESSGKDKYLGYMKALKDRGIPINEDYIKIAHWKKSEAYKATEDLLRLNPKPEAIYCANANMLIGCLRYLLENNISVPEDVALVTFDDYDFVSVLCPPVTSLGRVDNKIGEKAAELLYKRMEGQEDNYSEYRMGSELILRKSCGCGIGS
jgi:LacI family transcriptional regulator